MSDFKSIITEIHAAHVADEALDERRILTALCTEPDGPLARLKWKILEHHVQHRYESQVGMLPRNPDGTIAWNDVKAYLQSHWIELVGLFLQVLLIL